MKKHLAISLLGGNNATAARAMGVSKQAVRRWPVDAEGNMLSRIACDLVLAALCRENNAHRNGNPNGERYEFDEATLSDLFELPPADADRQVETQ